MKRVALLLAAIALLATSPSYSLVGSVYQGGAGATSSALPGALVYVHDEATNNDAWMGPIVTDAYGRFTFDGLGAGSYALRVFRNNVRVWQQDVSVPPGRPDPIIVPAGVAR